MESKTELTNAFDIVKWILVAILLIAGMVANSYFENRVPGALRLIGWIVLAIVMMGIAYQTQAGKQFWTFSLEARNELRKVVWPTRQETVQTTLVVMLLVLVVAGLLWLIDTGLIWVIGWLTGQRG